MLLHTRHPGVQGRCFERQPREGLGSQPRLLALQPSFPTSTAQPRPSSRSWAVPQGPAVPSSTQPAQGTGRVLPAAATPRVSGHPSQAQRLLLLHGHIPRIVMGSGVFPSGTQRSGGGPMATRGSPPYRVSKAASPQPPLPILSQFAPGRPAPASWGRIHKGIWRCQEDPKGPWGWQEDPKESLG